MAESERSRVESLFAFSLQVAVHLSRRGEDALRARGGGGLGEVLLGHLGQLGPDLLLLLPPVEDVEG